MSNTKKWAIAALECKPSVDNLTDVVSIIHWRKQATEVVGDKTYIVETYGSCSMPPADAESFIAFDSLTEETVTAWLEATLDVSVIDAGLDAKLELEKNPPLVQKIAPWMPTPNIDLTQAAPTVE